MPSGTADLDALFHALSDATRRAIVERLTHGAASVSTLAEPFAMSLPSVVQHLGVLERAGVVESEKTGRVRTYRLVPDATAPARAWLGRHRLPAEQRLDRLAEHLAGAPDA
ncbi:transcriptional regulator, ArsR family [Cellulomonas flavigena DSM 20109]|uniref:Transcriptional regulator, ArsR family n=1 Tax=Cellulomonas flavigena (strain ATCC 482 / DSM 20109 / BCRC 11376 / JCM 18109 / NBRC 3775 / NCIMB 8073 / NRS 134) TaxID=446466 RepID=D5UK34_CELFN|nr:transcriptional regulator, ArsR family [Cellulomonas flavigena DSM 20109]